MQHYYFPSFNQSDHCFRTSSLPVLSSILKLLNREFKKWRRQRARQRHKLMIWLVEWGKIIVLHAAARALRFLMQFFDVVCQRTTWNFHTWGSDDNASLQRLISHSLPSREKDSYQKNKKYTSPVSYNVTNRIIVKTLNLTKSYIRCRFRWSERRSFLKLPNINGSSCYHLVTYFSLFLSLRTALGN